MIKERIDPNSYKLTFDNKLPEEGIFNNCYVDINNKLTLLENRLQGSYVSNTIDVKLFKKMVISWRCQTSNESSIEILAQVRREDGKWSDLLSYGIWSRNKDRGSTKAYTDKIASINIDTITLNSPSAGNAIRLKINLKKKKLETASPEVIAIYISLNYSATVLNSKNSVNYIDLPIHSRSQREVEGIGNRICSATSLAMVMEYYGKSIDTRKAAEGVFDSNNDVYGNWAFNVAFANENGLNAYVAYLNDICLLKTLLENNMPVVCSVKTKDIKELGGAPQSYPNGHLLVVSGVKIEENTEYLIVNDPAWDDINKVKTKYKTNDFIKAWSGVSYVINK